MQVSVSSDLPNSNDTKYNCTWTLPLFDNWLYILIKQWSNSRFMINVKWALCAVNTDYCLASAKYPRIIFYLPTSLKQMPVFQNKSNLGISFQEVMLRSCLFPFFSLLPVLPFGLFTWFSCHKTGGLSSTPRGRLVTSQRTSGGDWADVIVPSEVWALPLNTLYLHISALACKWSNTQGLKRVHNKKVPEPLVKHP